MQNGENMQAQRIGLGRVPQKEFSFKNTGFIAPRGSTREFLLPISYDR